MIDTIGDRLKRIEQLEAGRKADPKKPLLARLDGKCFHTFTRDLKRPYDSRLSALMIDTTKYLVEKTQAKIAFTQSDEISLCWWNDEEIGRRPPELKKESAYAFDGKFQKITSVLAGMASAFFTQEISCIPEKIGEIVVFDCRAWNVDDKRDIFLNYLWRQDDAIKNSISMAAQTYFSSKQLHGIKSEDKKRMLREIGHPWEDMPQFFKMGTFIQRVSREVNLTNEEIDTIPIQHRPSGPIIRTFIEDIDLGYIKDNPRAIDIFS